jgi:polyisoprenoid-binding protein YceI
MSWQVDPAHSSIQFGVKHMLVATTRGRFSRYEVDAAVDDEQPEKSRATVTIDAASIETGQDQRDAHLRSPDFFDVERYPNIVFRTRRLEPDGDGEYRVIGDLTIRDVTREVALTGEVSGPITDAFGAVRAGISAEGKVNRKDFGLTWSAPVEAGGIVVGDAVKLSIDLELTRAA